MVDRILVGAHISSLFPPSHIRTVTVQTTRRNTPLPPPPTESDPPSEHCLHASTYYSAETGTIYIRLLQNGLVLELLSLTTDTQPLRFLFPSAIIPAPYVSQIDNELHILALTSTGSLYRLILPTKSSRLWTEPSTHNWCREYHLKNPQVLTDAVVQVQDEGTVCVGLANGALLRLSCKVVLESSELSWIEQLEYPSSFLSSFTSFLPLHQASASDTQIISIVSSRHLAVKDYVWTLSRDRSLRCWAPGRGCIATKTLLTSLSSGRELTPALARSGTPKPVVLLDPEPQRLLKVFNTPPSSEEDDGECYVLAFVPTPSSTASGGFFQLFSTSRDSLTLIDTIEGSESSVHCHLQDFAVLGGRLYTLWDRQGISAIERVDMPLGETEAMDRTWYASTYPYEPELTPAYLDEQLLSPGSMADRLFSAIMRPGMFSAFTLSTAIQQYTDACRSLPGPMPPQLTATYASVGENIAAVVGCTIQLTRDPLTGAPQHDKYWITLKRDWEGFIARCREIERSARWPVALGVGDPEAGEVMVIERERVSLPVKDDLAIRTHRILQADMELDNNWVLCKIAWTLYSKLSAGTVRNLEDAIVDLVHQEIAFPFADIILHQAQKHLIREDIDEGLESWMMGRVQSVEDIDEAAKFALDLIGGLEQIVKREEDEVLLLLPQNSSEWHRALTAQYISYSVHARYEFCLSLILLLFFLSEELQDWSPSTLAEIFAVFRGSAMLRYVCQQPAGDQATGLSTTTVVRGGSVVDVADEVARRMHRLDVSHSTTSPANLPLLHRMLTQAGMGGTSSISATAHAFIDGSGLLQSISPANVAKLEVMWCEKLRLLGRYEVAREMLSWLPRSPAVMYSWARVWLEVGRDEDAVGALECLAGSFAGPASGLSIEDSEALQAVLPGGLLFDSEFGFYLHASSLFKGAGLVDHEVYFAKLALSLAPSDWDTTELWYAIIKGSTDLGYWDDAYSGIVTTPYADLKQDLTRSLVYRMCEEGAVERLMSYNFVGVHDEVEESLSFKVRNADPLARPLYSRILYTWHITRGDYRKAALVMYQHGRRFASLMASTNSKDYSRFLYLAEQQLDAYLVAINSLSLVDSKVGAYIVLPASVDGQSRPSGSSIHIRKRRKLTKHIPEDQFTSDRRDAEFVSLEDIREEYAYLHAKIELIKRDAAFLGASDALLLPSSIVLRLAQANLFNFALSTARTLHVDMSDIFTHLTLQCLRVSRDPDHITVEDTSEWLLTDSVASWKGTTVDKAWRYLQQALERHDSPQETDLKYSKVVFDTISGFDRLSAPPPWLVSSLEAHHPDWLIRTCLRYEIFESALEQTLGLIKKSDVRLSQDPPRNAMYTWLPYTLIDQVLIATAEADGRMSEKGQRMRRDLQVELSNRTKKMQRLSQQLH